MGKRTSIIWSIDRSVLENFVKESNSIAQILNHFGVVIASGSYKTLRKRLSEEKIDYSHIPTGFDCNKGRKFNKEGTPLSEVLVENSSFCRRSLKRKLIKAGLLKNECCLCHLISEWQGKPLVLVLDHINGVHNDHRLENLRLLCPNCNSQTETFCGKNTKAALGKSNKTVLNEKRYLCESCKKLVKKSKRGMFCKKCAGLRQKRKIEKRPSVDILFLQVKELGYSATGRLYGVTDNAIRKWIRQAEISQKENESLVIEEPKPVTA